MSATLASNSGKIDSPTRPRIHWVRRIFAGLGIVLLVLLIKFILHLVLPRNFAANGETLPLKIAGGPFYTLYYGGAKKPAGIVIFGSGDGGWSYWEEKTAKHLVEKGYAVGGWDCRKYADSRTYNHAQLVQAFAAAAEAVKERSHAGNVPIWYGGWSTGAEQSVAAGASPQRPEHLVGLLLAAPGSVGRFGITTADLLGEEPSGPNTFKLADMAPALGGLHIVQFAAGLDPLDDSTWSKSLKTPYKLVAIKNVLHDMGGAGDQFQAEMDKAMTWTLQPQR